MPTTEAEAMKLYDVLRDTLGHHADLFSLPYPSMTDGLIKDWNMVFTINLTAHFFRAIRALNLHVVRVERQEGSDNLVVTFTAEDPFDDD